MAKQPGSFTRVIFRFPIVLVVVVASILIGLIWATIFAEISADRVRTEKDAFRDSANLALAFSEHTSRTLKGADELVLFVKYQYEKSGGRVDITQLLREARIDVTLFNQVGVIDEFGIYQLSNLADFKKVDLSDREHFKVHISQDSETLFVSKPVKGRASGKDSLQLTRRINKANGGFGGVVVVSVNPEYFSNIYKDLDIGTQGVIALVGLDGVVRARQAGSSLEGGQDVSKSRIFEMIKNPGKGSVFAVSSIDKTARFTSFMRIRGYPLWVIVGLGESEVLAPLLERRNDLLRWGAVISATVLALALFRLISARILLNSQRRAEAAAKTASRFLKTMARDLQIPLQTILNHSESLRRTLTTDEGLRTAASIGNSARTLIQRVSDVHDFAHFESASAEVKMRFVPVTQVLARLIETHSAGISSKGLALSIDVSPDTPKLVLCDPNCLNAILNQYMRNAIKFTETGSIRIAASRHEKRLRLAVTDAGPGIFVDSLSHIFDEFGLAEMNDTEPGRKPGVGLSLSKRLATLMQMEVGCLSEVGRGSEFYVLAEATNEPLRPPSHA